MGTGWTLPGGFFADADFDFETREALGRVANGTGDVGLVLATLDQIVDGDRQSWFDARKGTASTLAAPRDRTAVLRTVRDLVLDVTRRRTPTGVSVVIEGPPGIGKTFLVREILAGVGPGEAKILRMAGDHRRRNDPYAGFAELVGEVADGEDPGEAAFARVDELCAAGPVVVCADDAHHLDAASLTLLRRLVWASRSLPLVLLINALTCAAAAAGDKDRAALALDAALAGYQRMGAVPDRDRALGRARAVGLRRGPREAHRGVSSGWASLTTTEVRIAALVRDGLTNREVGVRLFVSPRTVQTPVSHILQKTGLRSRVEIARAAGAQIS
jgi:DNA-binding CsgD family transcriptional regulator